ncbi:septum formation initiator family protein, partial [Cellulomonas sp. APG4]|uniref:FtsB family cell division protein n=1 Tax=Cellulomonas sp. APG4 TaxID=1538656 RepID=UPI00137A3D8F
PAPRTRPVTRARAAAPPEPEPTEARPVRLARLLSARALVLAIVLLVAFSVVFPTVRAYLGQRAELEALAAEVEQAQRTEEDLAAELARWDDDAYVAAQARERLSYVLPGETPYRVIDPETVVEEPVVDPATEGDVVGPALPAGGSVDPWYATVWRSVEAVGEADVPVAAEGAQP